MKKFALGIVIPFFVLTQAQGIVINEIMYHPRGENEASCEWLELYNDFAVPLDIGGWSFSKGISFTFPRGTIMQGKSYLVVCADISTMNEMYDIPAENLIGAFEARLDNAGEELALVDKYGAVMAHVRYRDREPWPAGADGTGHSLALINTDMENDESESWAVSAQSSGSPGQPNGFKVETTITDSVLLDVGEEWKYFKGTEQPSDPDNAWIEPDFDDSGPSWLSGPTGIGYGDGDDATELNDMQNGYLSVFCRKQFQTANPSSIDTLMLSVDYDDGFIAYLNGEEIGRRYMGSAGEVFTYNMIATATVGDLPETAEITIPKTLLKEENALAIQIHNTSLGSSDLSMIPSLVSRTVETSGGVSPIPVVINEFLANSQEDTFVELFNNNSSAVDVSLAYLSDDRDNLTKYRIPEDTVLQPWEHISFTGTQMGFQMPAGNGALYFTNSDEERIIDAYAYGAAMPDISRGRYLDGEEQWYNMEAPTPGEANQISVNTSIVMNEIMYQPYERGNELEYIELYNRGTEEVDISGWRFSKGVDFTFPPGTTLQPDEYLVVAKDHDAIAAKYGIANVIGDYGGSLDNEGEKIELVDFLENVVDEVRYAGGGRWSVWAAGWGASLELIDPRQDNRAACAWAASDDSPNAEWTHVQYTGRFNGGESEFHFFLMHRGECLIDDISMKLGGQEYLANGSFESGSSGWKIEGNHIQSSIFTDEAHSGSECLKIIATGRGDTAANRIERDTAASLSNGQTYTVSFWVKWQRGINIIYTRTHNQGVAKATRFAMPDARGTPGRRNSVFSWNAGPVIWDVTQNPVVPKSSDPVRVTARISDSDEVASAILYYKGDYDGSYSSVQMYDDGLHGDRRPGDGFYAGQIPARGSTDLMRFYIVATDTLSASQRFPANGGTYCLYQIENSPPSTNLPIYRFLLTHETDQKLRSRNRFSNELEDCTFVLNDTQIYYNCGIRTRGSGWTRQNHPARQYRIRFPAGQPLRGVQREINTDAHGDGTKQHDRIVHHLMRELGGVPTSYHRYVHLRFNGSFRDLSEDILKVDGDYVRFYWPDDAAGTLFKVDDHFEWNDSWSHNHWDAYLRWEGTDKEEYRWNWELRTNEKEDDYSEFLDFVYFMDPYTTSNATFDAEAEDVLDVDEWLKALAVRFLVDDWDTLGYNRGKNAYIYKPYHAGDGTPEDPARPGRWSLLPWDSDLTFGNVNAPIVSSSFRSIKRMLDRPKFQRRYYSCYLALIDSTDGPFSRSNIDPVLDRTYNALAGESGRPSSPSGMKDFITNRISVIRSKIPSQAKFTITTNSGEDFAVDEPQVTLEGSAPFTARTMMLSINDEPPLAFEPTWTTSKNWRETFEVVAGENRMCFTGYDWQNNPVGTHTITVTWGLSPTDDSDGDGLYDKEEVEVYHTDYLNPDSDGDTLTDGDEVHIYYTDPNNPDTDEDGLDDAAEVRVHFTNPNNPDTDGDTLPDKWEVENDLDPNVGEGDDGENGDPDGDDLSNWDEYQSDTDPKDPDT
ncbi:lamin tail domain-containing protein, partial [bacterium]|nr:lamin tail domain-containing protein [bacterium]